MEDGACGKALRSGFALAEGLCYRRRAIRSSRGRLRPAGPLGLGWTAMPSPRHESLPRFSLCLGVLLCLAAICLSSCAGIEVKPKGQIVTGMSVGSGR